MNPVLPDGGPGPGESGTRSGHGPFPAPPANWRVALMDLIASRLALIQLESKDLVRQGIRHVICLVAACFCLFFTWALGVAGLVALIAHAAGWPWHWVALAAAGLHLLSAVILAQLAKPAGVSAFPVTRSEFQKDREWIENLQKTKKSSN